MNMDNSRTVAVRAPRYHRLCLIITVDRHSSFYNRSKIDDPQTRIDLRRGDWGGDKDLTSLCRSSIFAPLWALQGNLFEECTPYLYQLLTLVSDNVV